VDKGIGKVDEEEGIGEEDRVDGVEVRRGVGIKNAVLLIAEA